MSSKKLYGRNEINKVLKLNTDNSIVTSRGSKYGTVQILALQYHMNTYQYWCSMLHCIYIMLTWPAFLPCIKMVSVHKQCITCLRHDN